MISFWYFVPKSGVAFIFISVLLITLWSSYRSVLDYPIFWLILAELCLFVVCFYIADSESPSKKPK